jgi:hypothetical protein
MEGRDWTYLALVIRKLYRDLLPLHSCVCHLSAHPPFLNRRRPHSRSHAVRRQDRWLGHRVDQGGRSSCSTGETWVGGEEGEGEDEAREGPHFQLFFVALKGAVTLSLRSLRRFKCIGRNERAKETRCWRVSFLSSRTEKDDDEAQ